MAKLGKTGKAELRRDQLRQALISASERTVETAGLQGLRARALADEVGCSVGAIYNAVDDLDELILLVNTRTLATLERDLTAAGLAAERMRAGWTARFHAWCDWPSPISTLPRPTRRAGARCSITACRKVVRFRTGTAASSNGCSTMWRNRCASYSRALRRGGARCSRARCSLRCME